MTHATIPAVTRPVIFVGGPLNGQVAERIGEQWDQYRDDSGQPLSREIGDKVMYQQPAGERQHYYLAFIAGQREMLAAWAYVHLPLIGFYNAAGTWNASLDAAVEAMQAAEARE
jgi:hypothetical protein